MPRRKFPKKPEGTPLSLEEFCNHDDVCTDILVDKTNYTPATRKCQPRYTPLRSADDTVVLTIIHKLVVDKDECLAGLGEVMGLAPVARYLSSLDTAAERERFHTHAKMYVQMYKVDCPWEVTHTNRYTISSYEAAVVARASIESGPIPFLVGATLQVSVDERRRLEEHEHIMSVMESSKTGSVHVMLGPARFVNHDCNPNAELKAVGNTVEVVALRAIRVGEEVTVRYGGSYFGPDNQHCLCRNCELLSRNGWQASSVATVGATTDLAYNDRKRKAGDYLRARTDVARRLDKHPQARSPGDYVLTKKLLALKHDRWTLCGNKTCGLNFVQGDGYRMRRECLRCERHRVIYGQQWPRMDVAGEEDRGQWMDKEGPTTGKCGKGRWVTEEHEAQTWAPQLRAVVQYVPTAEAKTVTRQGRQIQADVARLRGEAVDDHFLEGDMVGRRSKRTKR